MQGDQQRPAVRRCVAPECNVKCFKQDALPLNILCWLFDWGGWDFWYIQFTMTIYSTIYMVHTIYHDNLQYNLP